MDDVAPEQVVYRKVRSTKEHVFAPKILCEKAVTSLDFMILLQLLDMSKAFHSIKKKSSD